LVGCLPAVADRLGEFSGLGEEPLPLPLPLLGELGLSANWGMREGDRLLWWTGASGLREMREEEELLSPCPVGASAAVMSAVVVELDGNEG